MRRWGWLKILNNPPVGTHLSFSNIKIYISSYRPIMQGLWGPEIVPQRGLRMLRISLHQPAQRVELEQNHKIRAGNQALISCWLIYFTYESI